MLSPYIVALFIIFVIWRAAVSGDWRVVKKIGAVLLTIVLTFSLMYGLTYVVSVEHAIFGGIAVVSVIALVIGFSGMADAINRAKAQSKNEVKQDVEKTGSDG
jgi:hypothetical protein